MSITTCGILFANDGKLLVGHVAGQEHWDIPKGKIELNETPMEAAIRETYEEAGILVLSEQLTDLGEVPYRRGKQLHLFMHLGESPKTADILDAIAPNTRKELDDFCYVDLSELHLFLNKRMMRALGRAIFHNLGTL